jgi:hypothetical protein
MCQHPLTTLYRYRHDAARFTNRGISVSVSADYTLLVKQQQLPEQVVLQRYVPEGLGILGNPVTSNVVSFHKHRASELVWL